MKKAEAKTSKTSNKSGLRFGIPFSVKLALIVAFILLGSIWLITSLMAVMVSSEFARTADSTNFDINRRAAAGVRERFYKIRSEALLLLDMDTVFRNSSAQVQQIRTLFFERNPGIAAVVIPGGQEIINRPFLTNNHISQDTLNTWIAAEPEAAAAAVKGIPVIKNASPSLGINMLAMFYPWQGSGEEQAAIIFFSPDNISEITGTGSSSTFIINGDGDILVHPDFTMALEGANITGSQLAEALNRAAGESVRLDYVVAGNRFIGAGHRIPFADAAVFSTMDYSIVTEQIMAVTRRNIYLSITILFLSILVTWFFSKTITNPIKRLTAAAAQIESGEYEIKLAAGSNDEIGRLTEQFRNMSKGLGKWDGAMNLAGRFKNRDLLNNVIQGKAVLKGEYKKAVVLSLDYQNFDEMMENQDAPQSLELLNSYIEKVSQIIEKNNGMIDKIHGGRIIAVWGLGLTGSEENESAAGIYNAVLDCMRSVIMIRTVFWDLNTDRESNNLPLYRIGCGIDSGEVLAGVFGAEKSGLYSFTGKIVEEAENACAACETANLDIIITSAVRNLAGNFIIAEDIAQKISKSQAKKRHKRIHEEDKNEPVLYGLVNLAPQNQENPKWPFTLEDVRESLKFGTLQKTEDKTVPSAE